MGGQNNRGTGGVTRRLVLMGGITIVSGCLSGNGGTAEPDTAEPSMDEALIEIANASDPERVAAERNVPYRDGAVRIEI